MLWQFFCNVIHFSGLFASFVYKLQRFPLKKQKTTSDIDSVDQKKCGKSSQE